ncbi:MAG: class I SAM-dependent methyltransferase [Fimbriimonas sp.]
MPADTVQLIVQADYQVLPCLVCDGTDFDVLLTPEQIQAEAAWLRDFHRARVLCPDDDLIDKAEFTQSEPVFLLRCNACRTLLRNPQPTPKALQARYRADEYGPATLQELLENERDFFRRKANSIDLPTGSRVLEIGSFVGAFLLAAKEKGWQATGIDIGKETCEFMRGLGLEVLEGDLQSHHIPTGFDAVFIWNTFDQINEPRSLLKDLRRLLKRDGHLVLRVPNGEFKSLALQQATDAARRAEAYNNFLTFPYLCGYTRESLSHLLNEEGFEVDRITGDVILPLATANTKRYAIEEEVRIKRLVMRFCGRSKSFCYPWMDVVANVI